MATPSMQKPPERLPEPLEEASAAELVREALEAAKDLVRTELELAKEEMKSELKRARRAAIGFAVAAAAGLLVLNVLALTIALAFGGTVAALLIVAACFLVAGGISGSIGYRLLPKHPLDRTRRRIESDVGQLEEHVA